MKKSIVAVSLIIICLLVSKSSINATTYRALSNEEIIDHSDLIVEGEFLTSNKSESFVLFRIDTIIMGTSPSETIAVHIWQDLWGVKFVVNIGDKCFLCMRGEADIDSQIKRSFNESKYSKYPLFATISFARYRLDDRYKTSKIKAIKQLVQSMATSDLSKSNIGIRADVGFGYIPMSEWVEWIGELEEIQIHNPSLYGDIGYLHNFGERHCLVAEVGLIKTTATRNGVIYSIDQQLDTIGIRAYWSDHILQTIPIGLGYEYNYPIKPDNFYLIFGIKGAFLFSKFHRETHTIYEDNNPIPDTEYNTEAYGYSIGVHLGLKSHFTDNLFMLSRLRMQYADGTASWENRTIKIEFTGIDLNFGFGRYF